MIPGVDQSIEYLMQYALHKQRKKHIERFYKDYVKTHSLTEEEADDLHQKLVNEIDRIYAMIDRSILRERIQRARYTFWITAILGTVITVSLASFPVTTGIAPFFVPLITAFGAWLIAIATIPIGYNQRIKGGLQSVIQQFENNLKEEESRQAQKQMTHELITSLQIHIADLTNQVSSLKSDVSQIKATVTPTQSSTSNSSLWAQESKLIDIDNIPTSTPNLRQQ